MIDTEGKLQDRRDKSERGKGETRIKKSTEIKQCMDVSTGKSLNCEIIIAFFLFYKRTEV